MTQMDTDVDPLRCLGRWFDTWIAALKDRRECPRMSVPVVAYYWNGGISQAYEVKTVSPVGAYLLTPDRWYPGTVLRLTFQYDDVSPPLVSIVGGEVVALMVRASIVRIGADGVGIRLVYLNKKERGSFENFLAAAPRRVVL
jgi:hypothetical protein